MALHVAAGQQPGNVPDRSSRLAQNGRGLRHLSADCNSTVDRYHRRELPEPKMTDYRVERDSMGDVKVPAKAYYGAQTQRAVENFPISGTGLSPEMIHALGLVKLAAGIANRDLGKLTKTGKNKLGEKQVEALLTAAREVAE